MPCLLRMVTGMKVVQMLLLQGVPSVALTFRASGVHFVVVHRSCVDIYILLVDTKQRKSWRCLEVLVRGLALLL